MESCTNKKVSVIIPCYNTAQYVEETLRSISNQTYTNIEIIAVDDGSTDNTFSILEQYKQIDDRLITVQVENGGSSYARMKGNTLAQGEYVLFLDSDDVIDATYIEKCITMAEQGYDVIYTKVRYFDRKTGVCVLPNFQLKDFLCSNCIPVNALIRKHLFDEVGGFDSSVTQMEDWECFISLVERAAKVYQIQEYLFFYRKRDADTSKSDTATVDEMEKNFLAIYIKHYEFYKKYNLGLKDLLWRMHKHRSNRWRRWAYKLFKYKKYLEEYEGQL